MSGERKHSPGGSKAASDRKVVVDGLGRHRPGSGTSPGCIQRGSGWSLGLILVETSLHSISRPRQSRQIYVRVPFPPSVCPTFFLPFFLPIY